MKRLNDKDFLKISELAKAAEVSVSTIHYYVQEGLLTPPARTGRNMAYYDPCSVQEIRLIQELQAKRFLPLSAIKLIMQAKRDGQAVDHLVEMRSFMENIFRPLKNETQPRDFSLAELAAAADLSVADLQDLEAGGLLIPAETAQGLRYDDIDFSIAQILKKLAGLGLKPEDLDIYRQYIEIIHKEAKAMHDTFHRLPNHEKIPMVELSKMLNDLKRYLAIKIYRQEAQHFHEHDLNPGKKK
jgi:DNA-binding transcriptional MerR regulator